MRPVLLLLLLPALIAAGSSRTPIELRPRLNSGRQIDLRLALRGGNWFVGGPTTMGYISYRGRYRHEYQRLSGTDGIFTYYSVDGNSSRILNRWLEVRCPGHKAWQRRSTADTDLPNLCSDTIPIAVIPEEYDFIIRPAACSKVPRQRTFTDRLELRMTVDFANDQLVSNSLFLISLDPLTDAAVDEPCAQYAEAKRFLSPEFMKLMSGNTASKTEFNTVQMIDETTVQLMRKAPALVQSHLSFVAMVKVEFEHRKSNSLMALGCISEWGFFTLLTRRPPWHAFLDRETGQLTYSANGISSALKFNRVKRASGISTAIVRGCDMSLEMSRRVVKLGGDSLGQFKRMRAVHSANCTLVGPSQRNVTLISGNIDSVIECPIVCSGQEVRGDFWFSYNIFGRLPINSQRTWYLPVTAMQTDFSGRLLWFPTKLTKLHAHNYRCEIGLVSASISVSVIAMPEFVGSGYLRPLTVGVDGDTLTFSCSATFIGIRNFTLTAEIDTNVTDGIWREVSVAEFNRLMGMRVVTFTRADTANAKTLTFTISAPNASAELRKFSHVLRCSVEVAGAEAERIAVPVYRTQTSTSVIFLRRPLAQTFTIRRLRGAAGGGRGAAYSVTLMGSLPRYLESIGVDVTADFKIGDLFLASNCDSAWSSALNVSFNSSSSTVTLLMPRFGNVKQLPGWRTLRPVFNFRLLPRKKYFEPPFANISSRLKVAAGGSSNTRDCRADPLCFFSTDFDEKLRQALTSSVQHYL